MSSQIKFKPIAYASLRALGYQREGEVKRYLTREVATWANPRRAGDKYLDRWRYETNGVVIEVEIVDNVKRNETADGKAEPEKATCDEHTIRVLGVWCVD